MYRENYDGIGCVRLSDNAMIPVDDRNADRQEYLKWLAEGNTPAPYETEVRKHEASPPSFEENFLVLAYNKGFISLAEVIDL